MPRRVSGSIWSRIRRIWEAVIRHPVFSGTPDGLSKYHKTVSGKGMSQRPGCDVRFYPGRLCMIFDKALQTVCWDGFFRLGGEHGRCFFLRWFRVGQVSGEAIIQTVHHKKRPLFFVPFWWLATTITLDVNHVIRYYVLWLVHLNVKTQKLFQTVRE